jgi:competence protein ComEA
MNKITAMLQTAALSLLLIGGAHASKAAPANKAAVVASASTASHSRSAKAPKQAKAAQKVNINTADAAAIDEALLDIGPSKAAAIVAYRKQHGAFHSADQLADVKGIGLKTIAKNRDRIVVGGAAAAASTTKR